MPKNVKRISLKEFGVEPESIEAIKDKGVVNRVYKVLVNGKFYIFRLNAISFLNEYLKEKYCIDQAEKIGVPVSTCYFVGTDEDRAYMILNYIEGTNGKDVLDKREEIYKKLGEYARKFNTIGVGGYGRFVTDSIDGFYKSWREYFDSKLEYIFVDGKLVSKGVMTDEQSKIIQERLSEMRDWDFDPKLCHGNLGISNTIITADDTCYIIDWGNAEGNRAPHIDLADIVAWKSTSKHLDYFLEGYGMTPEEFEKIEHDVNNALIIRLLGLIKKSVDEEKGTGDQKFIRESIERVMGLK